MDINTDITNSVLASIQEDSERTGQKVFHGLLDSIPINNIPESIFRDYFLPRFLGVVSDPTGHWMMEWVSVAGTVMSEVRVVNDSTGLELFMVPPVLNSNSLLMTKHEGDLGDIFGRYDQMSKNSPAGGLSFLIKALNEKNGQLMAGFDQSGVLGRWVDIITRYGYAPVVNTVQTPTETSDTDYFDM